MYCSKNTTVSLASLTVPTTISKFYLKKRIIMPHKREMGNLSRHKCLKVRILLVLLVLPVLPRKSEQLQKQFYRYPNPGSHSTTDRDNLIRVRNPNSINLRQNQWTPQGSPPYEFKASRHPQPSGFVTIRQIPSLPTSMTPVASPPVRFSYDRNSFQKKSSSCKGRKNILDDIGILSLMTALTSSSIGFYTILVNSMTSNNIGLVATFLSILIWVPSALITVFNQTGDLIYWASNYLNGLSLVNSMYGLIGAIFGTADVISSVAGESIGILSLILSVIATFPEYLDELIEYLYRKAGRKNRRRLRYYVENYGCSQDVPRIFSLIGMPLYDLTNKFLVDHTKQKGTHPID